MCEYLNGASSQGISSVEKSEIGRRVLPFQGDETKAPFVRGNNRFSLFKWLKRGNRDSTSIGKRRRHVSGKSPNFEEQNLSSSSTESISTFYSTTTVHSFAFQAGLQCNRLTLDFPDQLQDVGPFGSGAVKLLEKGHNSELTNINYTLPNIFSRKKDITERYSLQPSNSFNSCGNIPDPVNERNNILKRKKVHVKGKRRAPNPPGFKPKNIIGNNAEQSSIRTRRRKRRPAPRPPDEASLKVETCKINTGLSNHQESPDHQLPNEASLRVETCKINTGLSNHQENCTEFSNDTLILRGGILLPKRENKSSSECTVKVSNVNAGTISDLGIPQITESQSSSLARSFDRAMPRPWYKRNVFDRDTNTTKRGDSLRNYASNEKKEEYSSSFPFEGSLSKLNFFHRTDRNTEDRRKEVKRKSGISILTNISELDKEAAAIVQEEQARSKALLLLQNTKLVDLKESESVSDKEIVQDIIPPVESSPKRSTRALISKFNAITNLSKVTVNTNYFAKNSPTRESYFAKNSPTRERSNRILNDKIRDPQSKNDSFFDAVSDGSSNKDKKVERKQDLSRYFIPPERSQKLKTHFNQQAENSNKSYNHIIQRSHENLDNLVTNNIPEKNENKTENISNKSPSMKPFTHSRLPRADNGITDENKSLFSFTKKPFDKKILQVNNNTSTTMIKELDLIFNELDKQLENNIKSKENKTSRDVNLKSERESEIKACTSNQVSQIIDCLTESEKNAKRSVCDKRSIDKEKDKIPGLIQSQNAGSISKEKLSTLNTQDDPVTMDLKEILKEMKHSLPKRTKAKNIIQRASENVNVNYKPSASTSNDLSAFTTNLKRDILDKPNTALMSQEKCIIDTREDKKQKVSSAVQTSGNVRKVSNLPSTSKQNMNHNKIFANAKSDCDTGSKLKLNKFHLIKSKEFDEIEAIKLVKTPWHENIYANVTRLPLDSNKTSSNSVINIQRSELTSKSKETAKVHNQSLSPRSNQRERLILSGNKYQRNNFNDLQKQNMNTLAINKLLKKLEAAIASGNHQQAAMLAKELAQLKIQCSVIRQRSINNAQEVNINMYIEDKEGHQGPIPLLLPLNMTLAQLKTKISLEFEIPTNTQRWIIGKNLADNDDSTLEELQTTESIFLYLVAPETTVDDKIHQEKFIIEEKIENPRVVDLLPEATAAIEPQEKIAENTETLIQVEVAENESKEMKLERYEELMSLENCDLIPNSEPIECPICFVTYGPKEGITLRDCLHTFCRPCITNTIAYCEEAEVKCPFRDSVYTCESTLQEREIKALVAPEVYQQHLAKSITQAENNAGNNAFHCKTPDCPGWCIYDDNVNNFLCPVCRMNNCLTCQVIHIGKNCRQYQEELNLTKETDQESNRTAIMLEEMVNKGEAVACPTCAVILMKKWGCDWLRCSMCKTEICWVTKGPRWGPAGKGDTSGGCKCGENGIKCHPRCNYCH